MLALTRKEGQQVVIDGKIVVTLLRARGTGKARLGFEAPPEVDIKRREKYEGVVNSIVKGPFNVGNPSDQSSSDQSTGGEIAAAA